jgi:SAM-dependent methyltransferase
MRRRADERTIGRWPASDHRTRLGQWCRPCSAIRRGVGGARYLAPVTDETHLQATRDSYDRVAGQYTDYVLEVFPTDGVDRAMIGLFADLVAGQDNNVAGQDNNVAGQDNNQVADIGCGPGHITDFLARRGLSVRGIDLSPAMIALARRARPDLRFDLGSLLELDIPDRTLGGVLAHYSIIHTPPGRVPTAFTEFSRVLVPGGYLLVSFQTGDDSLHGWREFDHKAAPAYQWSLTGMAAFLAPAGLTEVARLRAEPSSSNRFHEGHLLARKAE